MDRKIKIALTIEALLIALLVFGGVILYYFSSVASLNTVLKNSNSYESIAEISQTKLRNLIPDDIKTDPLAYGVINWGITRFVDESLITKLSEPTLNLVVKLAQTPTTIQGSNIVLDTTKYKTNLTADIEGLNIPQRLKDAGTKYVSAIPQSLNVVNLNNRPNSILAKIIRLRDKIRNLKDIVIVLSLMVVSLAILIGVWSKESLNRAIRNLSLTVTISGAVTILLSGIVALVTKYVPPYPGGTILDGQINGLVANLSYYYLTDTAKWGLILLVVGFVFFFFTIDRVQLKIKEWYNKFIDMIGSKTKSSKN